MDPTTAPPAPQQKRHKKLLIFFATYLLGALSLFACLSAYSFLSKSNPQPLSGNLDRALLEVHDKYLEPTQPYEDINTYILDGADLALDQVTASVSKQKVLLDGVALDQKLLDYVYMEDWEASPRKSFAFIGDTFSFQTNDVVLVSITSTKQNQFVYDKYLENSSYFNRALGTDAVFTNVYPINLREGASPTFRNLIGNDLYAEFVSPADIKYIPLCFDDEDNSMYVIRRTAAGDTFYRARLPKMDPFSTSDIIDVEQTEIPCLELIRSRPS